MLGCKPIRISCPGCTWLGIKSQARDVLSVACALHRGMVTAQTQTCVVHTSMPNILSLSLISSVPSLINHSGPTTNLSPKVDRTTNHQPLPLPSHRPTDWPSRHSRHSPPHTGGQRLAACLTAAPQPRPAGSQQPPPPAPTTAPSS